MSPELAIPKQFSQTQTNIPEDTRIYSGNIPWPVPVVYSVQNPPPKKKKIQVPITSVSR